MKKVIFIIILIAIVVPMLILAGEITKKIDWGMKEFLAPPPISDALSQAALSKKDAAPPSVSRNQRPVQAAARKKAQPEKQKSAEEKSAQNWCQSDRILMEGGAAVADEGIAVTICGTMPSSRLLLATGGAGALSFGVLWQGETAASPQSAGMPFAPLNCAAAGVSTVRATAYGPSQEIVASGGPWECSGGIDTIYDIPPGQGITLVVVGENASGDVVFRGEQGGIAIAAGRENNIGAVKTTPFSLSLGAPADAEFLMNGRVAFTWTGASGMSSYQIQVARDPGFDSPVIDADTATSSFTASPALASRTYFWRVRGTDEFNNSSEWSEARSVTIDTLPQFSVTAKFIIDHGIISTNSATVSLLISAAKSSGADIAAYYFSEDPARPTANARGWRPVSPAKSYSSVLPYTLSGGDGPKTIFVWFKDGAGRVSKPARDTIIFDATPPRTAIIGKPANPTNASRADFNFTSSKDGSTFRCSLDEGAYTP
ncbi:MAG TPA: hypothetical protein VF903_01715, partial [Nitrospirota bacterium]